MSQHPLLIVVAGAGRGRSVPLAESVSIGRGDDNVLAIPDPALSRHHCVVAMGPNGPIVRDLDSKNGVFVNGCPVTERALADSDQIRIGDSAILVVASKETAAHGPRGLMLVETPAISTSTIAIDAANSRYVRREEAMPADQRAAGDLKALLALSEALHSATTTDRLQELLLTHALTAFRASGAAIVSRGPDDHTFTIVSSQTREGAESATVNQLLVARSLGDGVAVLSNDSPAMCAPTIGPDGTTTALFVARSAGAGGFTEDDLQVLAAMGSIGGIAIDRVRHIEWLTGETQRLRSDLALDHNLIGESAPMQAVYHFVSRVAATDATVMLRGESGTGKELVASAIHRNGTRAQGPFIPINCAALPEGLLESELFGHERGAFTGAVAQQRGRLELAHGGTVFLDEIGELAPPLQAKLLRVLQDHVVERVGARRGIKIDVRVIAATNRDLETAIASGAFREDLYFRLNVVSLSMPPLRARRDDLPLLAAYFVRQHATRCKRNVKGISTEARKLLMAYDWPGNVRELSNAIERAVVLGSLDVILPEDLPDALLEVGVTGADAGFHSQVADRKRDIIRAALDKAAGNVAKAARDLALQPTYLHRLIRHLNVRTGPPS
jgi:DNA-binding NtrC family response regulator/pSer/pThr/pTyr-binding forkhead associated (FHA) protein